jgi:hypothetical protein
MSKKDFACHQIDDDDDDDDDGAFYMVPITQ